MATNPYAELMAADAGPEVMVRRGLRLLECDFRELALRALADWERMGLVAPELFAPVAALQRPSWGMWNGLLVGLRNARKGLLRTGDAETRSKLEPAGPLLQVLTLIDEVADPATVGAIGPLAAFVRIPVDRRPRVGLALTLPISLRNRVAHDAPDDPAWWSAAADALRPLLALHAGGRFHILPDEPADLPAPWLIVEDGGEVWSFNGIEREAALYASRSGAVRADPDRLPEVVLAFQRLLGKADSQVQDVRRLLARVAPEEIRGVLMGDYLVGRAVGSGGFATVHLGRQLSTGRKVAVKILHDGFPEEDRLRFRQEAAYLSRFNHPNIVGVVSYGEEVWSAPRHFSLSGEPWFEAFSRSAHVRTFIALEWVDGETLEDMFRRAPGDRPSSRALGDLFLQAAEALQAVHAVGLLHRDVKPGNLMVTPEGRLKLMDFGIARSRDELRTIVTATGRALGTPAYMAPEQIRAAEVAAEVGPASDVYALCATFYELFTGCRLFRHDTETAESVAFKKLNAQRPEDPRRLARDLPWEIATILKGGLEPEVADRYRSMADLGRDIRHAVRDEPIEFRSPSPARRLWLAYRRNRTIAHLVAGFLVLAVAGVTQYILALRDEQQRTANQRTIAERKSEESDLRLERQYVAEGVRRMEADDLTAALPWFAEALRMADASRPGAAGRAERIKAHRVRLGNALRSGPAPIGVFPNDRGLRAVFSPDGRLLATADGRFVRVRSVESGRDLFPPREHNGAYALAFRPDGLELVSGGRGARVWGATTGAPSSPGFADAGTVERVAFSPDGRHVITVSHLPEYSPGEQWWDAATGRRVEPVPAHGQGELVAFSRDGARFLTVRSTWEPRPGDETRVWDTLSGRPVSKPLEHEGTLAAADLSADGARVLAIATSDKTLRVWDVATGRETARVTHGRGVVAAVFSPDGRRIATISERTIGSRVMAAGPQEVRVWDAGSGGAVGAPIRHEDDINSVAFSPDGGTLATLGADAALRFWRPEGGQPCAPPLRHEGPITSFAFHPDGRRILTVGLDGSARLWDRAAGPGMAHVFTDWHGENLDEGRVETVGGRLASYSPDGKQLLTVSLWRPGVWDADTGEPAGAPLKLEPGQAVALAVFSPDGRSIATAAQIEGPTGRRGEARVWDWRTGEPASPPMPHGGEITQIAFRRDVRAIVTACRDGFARVWDVATGRLATPRPMGHPAAVLQAAISRDGTRVVTACEDGIARVWDAVSGRELARSEKHVGPVNSVALDPSGHWFVTASGGLENVATAGSARVWDAGTGRAIGPWMEHRGRVISVRFDPAGTRVVTASDDHSARVWDAATGRPVSAPLRHGQAVVSAEFSPDGVLVLTASGGEFGQRRGEVRVWEAASGQPVTPAWPHALAVTQASFRPDGRAMVSSGQGTVRTWDVSPDPRPVDALLREARLRSGGHIDATADAQGFVVGDATDFDRLWRDGDAAARITPMPRVAAWYRIEAEAADDSTADAAALWHLDRLLDLRPVSPLLLARRGRVRARLRLWDQAAADYAKAIALRDDRWEIHANLARAHEGLGAWALALDDYSKAIAMGADRWEIFDRRGQAFVQLGRRGEAIEDFGRAIGESHGVAWLPLYHRGRTLIEVGRPAEAIEDLRRAAQWMRNGPHAARVPESRVWAFLGEALAETGEFAEADHEFAEAIRILAEQRDDNASLDFLHGMLRLHAGDVAGYHRIRRATLESFRDWQNPTQLRYVTTLAVIGPPDPADDGLMIVLAERWNRLAPNDPLGSTLVGAAYLRAGRLPLALRALRAAVGQADPDEPPLAALFLALSEHQAAEASAARRRFEAVARTATRRRDLDWASQLMLKILIAEARSTLAAPGGELPEDVFAR
jgi:WD40 repeat protein/serine/threonine protein kinase/tetratricopeptide (TPR) repeat protein